jgi:Holliday junction resolvasome RuvABC endonuclease subunit
MKYQKDSVYHQFMRDIQSIILSQNITQIVLEDCYLGVNPATFRVLARLQGIVLAVAGNAGIPVDLFTASEWRNIVGRRANIKLSYKKRADCKAASLELARKLLPSRDVVSEDIADAVCLALVTGSMYSETLPIEREGK